MSFLEFTQILFNLTATFAVVVLGIMLGVLLAIGIAIASAAKRTAERIGEMTQKLSAKLEKAAAAGIFIPLVMGWLKKRNKRSE